MMYSGCRLVVVSRRFGDDKGADTRRRKWKHCSNRRVWIFRDVYRRFSDLGGQSSCTDLFGHLSFDTDLSPLTAESYLSVARIVLPVSAAGTQTSKG